MKMKQHLVAGFSLFALAAIPSLVLAQERVDSTDNAFSAHPIPDSDVLMKKTLWRRVDLKEKQNLPMFSVNNEITRYLLDAAKAGLLDAYTNDSCKTKLDTEGLRHNLIIPNQGGGLSADEIAAGFGQTTNDGWGSTDKTAAQPADDGWGNPATPQKPKESEDDGWGTPVQKKTPAENVAAADTGAAAPADAFQQQALAPTEDEYFPNQLSILELKENWVFDKKRSRLYMDIQTITIYLPADQNDLGIEKPVASFRYKDVERLFRSDSKRYIWYNAQNDAQHKNLADAFDNRLFWGRITKYSNPEDKGFLDLYKGGKEGLLKSLQFEQELMEKEHGLWEY